jgi:hypothetical protein
MPLSDDRQYAKDKKVPAGPQLAQDENQKSSVLAGGGVSSLPLSSIALDRSWHGVHQCQGGGVEHDQCGQKALLRKKITK